MSKYYNLKVQQVIKETEDAVTIIFAPAKEKIVYKPGQFLTLIVTINGQKHRRSYSLCSSPSADRSLAVTVKKLNGGLVSTYLVQNVKVGVTIEVMQPSGNFIIDTHNKNKRNIVLIGAGSGITPLLSIAKEVLSQEPFSNVYMVYGNRNEKSIILQNPLESLKKQFNERLNIHYVFSQPINKTQWPAGRINQTSIIKILESNNTIDFTDTSYFLCGPQGLMEEARKALEILQVPSEKIYKENFAVAEEISSNKAVEETTEIQKQEVTILYQGSEYKITVPSGKSILQAGLDQKIDLPYSCQSGMCTACMGKCTNGKVRLSDPDGLSENEIKQGFVLTCVGYPASAGVVIEID